MPVFWFIFTALNFYYAFMVPGNDFSAINGFAFGFCLVMMFASVADRRY